MSTRFTRTPRTPSARRENRRKENLTMDEGLTTSTRTRRVRASRSPSDSDIENRAGRYLTRSRTRKEEGSTKIQDSINLSVENEVENKKRTTKKRVLTQADNTLTENRSRIKGISKSTRSHAKNTKTTINPISDTQGTEIQEFDINSTTDMTNKKSSAPRIIVETPRKISPRTQSKSLLEIAADTVTPESSPIIVDLTPHRSTKTPIKSPVNIGSPKTHSELPLRLSKTPRKLTVGVESPATSDKSNQSPTLSNSLDANRRNPFVVLKDFNKEGSLMTDKSSELLLASVKTVISPSAIAPKKKIKIMMELGNSSPGTTPRGRIRRSLNLTPDFIKFSSGSTSSPLLTPKIRGQQSSPVGFSSMEKSKMILDESLELIDGSKFMNVSDDVFTKSSSGPADGTYELAESKGSEKEAEKSLEMLEKTEVDDATYELAEPKTPSLKKKSRKRSLSNVESDKCTPEAKKRCRVRFASSTKEKTLGSALDSAKKSVPTSNTPTKQRIARGLSRGTALVLDNSRRRSRSLTKIENKSLTKRRSFSVSDVTNKTPKLDQRTQDSVNRLSKPRQSISSGLKSDVKLPVPRKVPNFAQIHQKKFAEMESLVDAKKRVARRHEELSTQPSTSASQSFSAIGPSAVAPPTVAPPDEQNENFTRFGFRVRKAEAVKIMSKKPAAARIKNHQESTRSMLKGVRTNRRFELLMQARKNQQSGANNV